MWTNFGRRIVGNLTTVSTSLRDFTTTMLGYAFIEHMEGEVNEVDPQASHREMREEAEALR